MVFKARRFYNIDKGVSIEKRKGSQTEPVGILTFRDWEKEKKQTKKKERPEKQEENQESVVTWMPNKQRGRC